jgi:hypothetical protein
MILGVLSGEKKNLGDRGGARAFCTRLYRPETSAGDIRLLGDIPLVKAKPGGARPTPSQPLQPRNTPRGASSHCLGRCRHCSHIGDPIRANVLYSSG